MAAAIAIVQSAKNSTPYQVNPLVVTLPNKTASGSYIVVIVEGQKSGYPYNAGEFNANTTPPTITDNKGNTYTPVSSIVNVAQDITSGSPPVSDVQPDASGYFPSLYVYISSSAAITNTQAISVSAFYANNDTSPPLPSPDGRPVFDGGLHAQAFEVSGLSTGVDGTNFGTIRSAANNLGNALITSSDTALIFEVGVLLDSASIISHTGSTLQYQSILYGGSSHFVVQTTAVTGPTTSSGFNNSLLYTGAVAAISVK